MHPGCTSTHIPLKSGTFGSPQEVARLRAENAQALGQRRALEDELIAGRAALEEMKGAQASLQQELDGMHTQVGMWADVACGTLGRLEGGHFVCQ